MGGSLTAEVQLLGPETGQNRKSTDILVLDNLVVMSDPETRGLGSNGRIWQDAILAAVLARWRSISFATPFLFDLLGHSF